jgi:catechol 2,3-dioxygenase-like lactoylglutathione lyase family enzyme
VTPDIVGSDSELEAQGVVEVVVPDLRAALTFYLRLGFLIDRETPGFVTLRWDNMFLFVAENRDAPTAQRWTNVRIIVPSADVVWQRVNQLGLPVGNPIADRPYGLRDFTVKDPAGFEIRFAEVLRG